jgi:hypothetical protein
LADKPEEVLKELIRAIGENHAIIRNPAFKYLKQIIVQHGGLINKRGLQPITFSDDEGDDGVATVAKKQRVDLVNIPASLAALKSGAVDGSLLLQMLCRPDFVNPVLRLGIGMAVSHLTLPATTSN